MKKIKIFLSINLIFFSNLGISASIEEVYNSIQLMNTYFAMATDYISKGDMENGCEYGKKAIAANNLYKKKDYPVELYNEYDTMMKSVNNTKLVIQKNCK
jgi:hypothetical protein